MSHYHHLTITERESIWEMKIKGYSIREIAKAIGRSPSTVSRELKRNRGRKYQPSKAQAKYQERRKRCRRRRILDKLSLREIVVKLLVERQWSPEQISRRLRMEGKGEISYTTLYRALKKGYWEPAGSQKQKGKYPMQRKLRRKGKPKGVVKPRGSIEVERTIEERPESANKRSRAGHWEGDTVCISRDRGYVLTFVDRRSRYLLAGSCASKNQKDTAEAMLQILGKLPKEKLRTLTLDRGPEFSDYRRVSTATGLKVYFAHPQSPWERGTNENTNGLLREYIPKRSYTTPFSDELLEEFVFKLNTRPRKCLNWKSPFQVFFGILLHLT